MQSVAVGRVCVFIVGVFILWSLVVLMRLAEQPPAPLVTHTLIAVIAVWERGPTAPVVAKKWHLVFCPLARGGRQKFQVGVDDIAQREQ